MQSICQGKDNAKRQFYLGFVHLVVNGYPIFILLGYAFKVGNFGMIQSLLRGKQYIT